MNNPALRMRLDPTEPGLPATSLPANQATMRLAEQEGRNIAASQGRVVTRSVSNFANGPTGSFLTARAGETTVISSDPPPTVAEANAEANPLQQAEGAPARRVENFRYLTVAESARDRDLEVRRDRLERRLETVNNRLQFAASLMVQIDVRLERARLERDLEMVGGEIRRLRLERAFERPPTTAPDAAENMQAVEQADQPAGRAFPEPQPIAPDRAPVINMLA